MNEEVMRLQKYLAQRGVASRRAAEEMITAGRIAINGRAVTELGTRVCPARDQVAVDGVPLRKARQGLRTIVLNKPRGYVCSSSAEDGTTVFELLPGVAERLVSVGRLDKASEGLLLLSNDGDLVNQLTHPRYEKEKIYRATVSGAVSESTVNALRRPMDLDGYVTRPAKVTLLRQSATPGRQVLEITLREGRNRQIRRMCEAAGLQVHRLVRVQVGPLKLGGLRPGQWRDLTTKEIAGLTQSSSADQRSDSD
jgi:23S rRNA pseudouridine2605 synthase